MTRRWALDGLYGSGFDWIMGPVRGPMRHILLTLTLAPLFACPGSGTADAPLDPNAPKAEFAPPEGAGTHTEDIKVEPGTGVVLSGTFTYTGDLKGTYRVDISAPAEAGGPPTPVAKLSLPATGPWEVEVPKNLGTIMVLGFIELGKGPGPDSPSATVYGLSVAETPLTDIVLAPALGGVITGTPPGPASTGEAPPAGAEGGLPAGDGIIPAGEPLAVPATPGGDMLAPVAPAADGAAVPAAGTSAAGTSAAGTTVTAPAGAVAPTSAPATGVKTP